jgi:hypothetical protein
MTGKYFQRDVSGSILKWMGRKEIIAIRGPRQAGKTTMVRHMMEEMQKSGTEEGRITFVTFEDLEMREKFSEDPAAFVKSFAMPGRRHYFFFDEFQYVEEGGQKLKLLYDTMDDVKFVVTGSSSLEISKFSKYLVGRVFLFELYPFSFHEFLAAADERLARIYEEKNKLVRNFIHGGGGFSVEKDIFAGEIAGIFEKFALRGGYPETVIAPDEETMKIVLKNLYETYIRKDIVELLKIKDIFKFRKLVRILAAQSGGIANYNELAATCGSYYKETTGLLSILEETYVIRTVRPFHSSLGTELKKNPKIYFFDNGLRNHIINSFGPLDGRPDGGMVFENAVLGQLFSIAGSGAKINFWRTTGGAEVDFIIDTGSEAIPVEAKSGPVSTKNVPRGLANFIEAYKPGRAVVVTKDIWGMHTAGRTVVMFIPACYL